MNVELVSPITHGGQSPAMRLAAARRDALADRTYVTQGEWWRIGFIMSVIYLTIWLFIGPLWWMLLGHV